MLTSSSRPVLQAARRHQVPSALRIISTTSKTETPKKSTIAAAINSSNATPTVTSAFASTNGMVVRPAAQQTRPITVEALDKEKDTRERVVVLGTGWGGFATARKLDTKYYQPIIIAPRTHFVFTPLLASTAVGTLEFGTAIESSHRLDGVQVIRGWADELDVNRKTLRVRTAVEKNRALVGGDDFEISYDKLVVAVGAFNQTFGVQGVKEHCYFLKDIQDARAIRRRVFECFEEASLPTTSEERKRELLNFAIVGGGPTGIEFSAELNDCINEDLSKAYPGLDKYVKITIYDVAPRILAAFDANLAAYAEAIFKRRGVVISTKHNVVKVEDGAIHTKEDGRIPVGMCLWSTGLAENPFITNGLKAFKDLRNDTEEWEIVKKRRTIDVDTYLRAKVRNTTTGKERFLDDVFAIGDCANVTGTGKMLPATAQVASQEAVYLAKTLNTAAKYDRKLDTLPEFRFHDFGIMTYLGDWKAIAKTKRVDFKGRLAWVLWRGAYLTKSVSFRNKFLLCVYWATNWIMGRDINRF